MTKETESNIENKKHHTPSYYRYKVNHKSISISYERDDYDKIISHFGNISEIRKFLLNIANGQSINSDLQSALDAMRKRCDGLLRTNKWLIKDLNECQKINPNNLY